MSDNKTAVQQEEELFSLKNFFLLCLGYWKWFLLSVFLFGGMGLFYVYKKQPVYLRYEEVLIKDQENGSSMSSVGNSFSQLGLFANNAKVYNEIISFSSPAVMYEVVKNLRLYDNYTQRRGVKNKTLYGSNLPILIDFPDMSEKEQVGFRINLEPDGSFEIEKIWKGTNDGPIKYEQKIEGKVNGAPLNSPIGKIVVESNPRYVPDLEAKPEMMKIDFVRKSMQLAVEYYEDELKADLTDQDADVIRLSIEDTSIERADEFLSMVVSVYNSRWIEDKNKVALATSQFISERLAVIQEELGSVDKVIAEKKSQIKIPDMEKASEAILEQGVNIHSGIFEASNKLAMSQYLRDYVEKDENKFSIIPMNTGIENPTLETEISNYNQLLFQRNSLIQNSSDNNPLVKDYNAKLEGSRNAILFSLNTNISNLENSLKTMDKAYQANMNQLGSAPTQVLPLLSEERQQLVMEELYIFLLQKREENELTQSFTADNNRIITPPYGKHRPVAPRRGLIIVLSVLFGLGIPAAILYLVEASNTKIRSKKDLENLPVPFVGEIPMVGRSHRLTRALRTKKKKQKLIDRPNVVVSEGKRDIPNEAFRVVRSNIDLMKGKNEHVVLALTSFNPGSGKSFVTYNLGLSFAIKGKRVLIIDGDLRHGSLSIYAGKPHRGLTSYLTGDVADWETLAVTAEENPNLQILPIGHKPPNPAELLENGRLEALLKEAREAYDVVLIDCPPVNIVVDTQIINQYVDRTIFVVRAGLLEKKALKELINIVDDKKLNNITVLLNGTRTEFSSYHTYGNYEAIDKG
ncbi:MAG: polysaccharide biosynthesis tyrosine autokinase [Muribaculaceae bacterium]|nr:polysaccharide biosynthesis tyrosine autokinase [Muribaculaceae bacterium]